MLTTKLRKRIDIGVIAQIKDKIARLAIPSGTTVRKVLLYSGNRVKALQDSIYFDRQLAIDELLQAH